MVMKSKMKKKYLQQTLTRAMAKWEKLMITGFILRVYFIIFPRQGNECKNTNN